MDLLFQRGLENRITNNRRDKNSRIGTLSQRPWCGGLSEGLTDKTLAESQRECAARALRRRENLG